MNKRLLYIICMAGMALGLNGCANNTGPKTYNPATVNFKASYNANMDGIIYPSMLLALANYSGPMPQHLFNVEVTAPANDAVLRVVVDSSRLNYVTILQEVLPKKGTRYSFEPLIKWKFDQLYNMRQQGAVDMTFTCYVNDEEVDLKNLRLNYRTVNECPLTILDTAGKAQDYRWLFAAYVNEDHPYIDSILSDVLKQGLVTRFTGYQKGEKEVTRQVEAIWYYALNRGITYSSISCTSNPSRRGNAQHIRFFDEVYLNRQANCIDACVFFASIFRKIGLHPVILLEPCHAYLGYYTDKNKKHLALLETTITSWVNFPALDASAANDKGTADDKQLKKVERYVNAKTMEDYRAGNATLDDLKKEAAHTLFLKAAEHDREQYNANRKLFNTAGQNGYQMLDIAELRKMVQPIER